MTDTQHDEVMPEGQWQFDAEVASVFDDMLSRSIPEYGTMRDIVSELAARSAPEGGRILDLGCSRGEALARVLDHPLCSPAVTALGLEVSEPMLALAKERFAGDGRVEIRHHDLRTGIPSLMRKADVILSVLCILFTPMQWRHRLFRDVAEQLAPDGTFILVEKVLGGTARIDDLLTETYHDYKRGQGYSDEQIERKALALEGVQVPVTAAMNEDFLRQAGFRSIDCVWRWGPFAAWVAYL